MTFENLLILSDQEGIVDMTPEALARRTTIPLEIIQKGLQALEMPDSQSRTPDEDGKRIVRLSDSRPWGWRIVNYLHYRNIRNAEDRREYMKNYQREYRKQCKPRKHSVNNCKQSKPIHNASASSSNSYSENFTNFWNSYPSRKGKKPEKGRTQKLFLDLSEEDQLLAIQAAQNFAKSERTMAGVGIRDPKRFLKDAEGYEFWREWIEPEAPTTIDGLSKKLCWKRIQDGEHFRPCNEAVVGIVNNNPYCAKHPVPAMSGVPL